MREMVRCLDRKVTARVKAVLQFEFTEPTRIYRVEIDSGQCALAEGSAEHPDLCIRCASSTWAALFMRQINAREALKNRQIVLEGDRSLFARLDRFFPPPAS